jgi:hypothetical protein
MASRFQHAPNKPAAERCQDAYLILKNAHDAASSFLEIFTTVRISRHARGAPTDEEQDLLRAMFIFSTAGLDSMVKQLVRDCLPSVVDSDPGAIEQFKRHIERRLLKVDGVDRRFLADVLGDPNPRTRMMNQLVDELCGGSLQSTEQLFRVAAFFNIPSNKVCDDPERLNGIFCARNQIAHEMDVDFSQPNRSRRPRARRMMIELTNEIFRVSSSFLSEVDGKLKTQQVAEKPPGPSS